jgi:hypothetical protein
MGTGTNAQKKLVALHHLDAPWKPAEVEQREGRILRQGNENEQVAIYRYVTEGSFDAYMWQALETKARFIAQVMTGENPVRRAEDIGGQELSYAEVKAIASGNPAVLTLAEADAELQRLNLLKRNHLDEQYLARRNIHSLPQVIVEFSERLANLKTDLATVTRRAGDPVTIGHSTCSREEATGILAPALETANRTVREVQRMPLGVYCGLRFGLVLHPRAWPDVYLQGAAYHQAGFLGESHGPRAVLNAVERLAGAIGTECTGVEQQLAVAESQLRDYQASLGKPFLHDTYLTALTGVRDRLKDGLAVKTPESGADPGPVFELAEQVKALKAANSLGAAPERVWRKRMVAAESVTARIRRRMGTAVASDGETQGG